MAAMQWRTLSDKFAMQSPSQSQIASPMFRLDLKTHTTDTGLRFPDPPKKIGTTSAMLPAIPAIPTEMMPPWSTLRFIAITQVFVIVILFLMVFGLLYSSWRLNSIGGDYFEAAQPYISQVVDHGMNMVRHVDTSSAALEHMMLGADAMTSVSIPALMDAVNNTVNMVASLEHVMRNPTVRLSLG